MSFKIHSIYILGWGSLITRPGILKSFHFFPNGPILPIQFSRISRYGSITLVIDPDNGIHIQTWFAVSKFHNLEYAITNLKNREMCSIDYIGFINLSTCKFKTTQLSENNIKLVSGNIDLSTMDFISDHTLSNKTIEILKNIIIWCMNKSINIVIWTAIPTNFYTETNLPWSYQNLSYYLSILPRNIKSRTIDYITNIPNNVYDSLYAYCLLYVLSL